MIPLKQHQVEIEKNLRRWNEKPLLQEIYAGFYRQILAQIDSSLRGKIVELGSGIGNLRTHFPHAICTDLFPNPWLDLVCDAYELPFRERTIANLVLFDVFHHLQAPFAFFAEAKRVLVPSGRLILFEPYISLASFAVYGLLHHEPLEWRARIDLRETFPRPREYYAAQGNATRLFFKGASWLCSWKILHKKVFSSFAYFLSGGYSKPALYPKTWIQTLGRADAYLSRFPRLFGGRCLVVLSPT